MGLYRNMRTWDCTGKNGPSGFYRVKRTDRIKQGLEDRWDETESPGHKG
jgi:hypothetical protein